MAAIVGQRAARPGPHRSLYASAALALAVEVLLLAGVGAWLIRPQFAPPPRRAEPMTLALAPPDPAPKPVPKPVAPATPVVPKPVPPARRAAPAHRARVARAAAPKRQPQPQPQPASPPSPGPTPAPVSEAAPAAPVAAPTAAPSEPRPTPPTPAAATGRPDASFAAALRAAIQAALRYPASARMEGKTGRTLVAFVYRDSAVSDIRVVTSSGMGLLDHAAVSAVRDAACPPPPHGMEGKRLPEQLWIDFRLDGNG